MKNRISIVGAACALLISLLASRPAHAADLPPRDKAEVQYLGLLENFTGWAEGYWNEKEQCFNGQGAGVSWARGNGDMCLVYATLLTELPDQATFSPKKITRAVMLDHVQKSLRALCLRNKNCTDPRAVKPPTWGGPEWQSALETEHWLFAAYMLKDQLDDDTKTLVHQVGGAEADASKKTIPQGKRGDTAADDCCWNAGVLGVAAAVYPDDPRAKSWDEWSKKWALNIEAREPDRNSSTLVDGKPLSQWLVSTQTYPDFTLENHNFWDLPYQTCFAALLEPIVAYAAAGKPVPESYHFHLKDEGDILKWMTLADGDLLYVQGIDWAELDVQHSWAYTEFGTIGDMPWARAAEARCIKLLVDRQKAFGNGDLHANDFGYQTDLANCWAYSALAHKYFSKGDSGTAFDEPTGTRIFKYVDVAVYRTPNLVSSITWFRARQCMMIVPNNIEALGDRPSFSAYRCKADKFEISGTGFIQMAKDKKVREATVNGEPKIGHDQDALTVSFSRTVPKVANQKLGYCALPTGQVVLFSQWKALNDIQVEKLIAHPFYWNAIPGYLPTRTAKSVGENTWSIDGKLQMQVIGGKGGVIEPTALLGSARMQPFSAKAGETMDDSVCIYQAEIPGQTPLKVSGDINHLTVGDWKISRGADGSLTVTK